MVKPHLLMGEISILRPRKKVVGLRQGKDRDYAGMRKHRVHNTRIFLTNLR